MKYTEQQLDALLDNWVAFYGKADAQGLGYPSMTPEARFIQNGAIVTESDGTRGIEINDNAQMIENYWRELKLLNSDWALCFRDKYFCRLQEIPLHGRKRNVISRLAYNRGIGNRMFIMRVKWAKEWMLDRLNGMCHDVRKCRVTKNSLRMA